MSCLNYSQYYLHDVVEMIRKFQSYFHGFIPYTWAKKYDMFDCPFHHSDIYIQLIWHTNMDGPSKVLPHLNRGKLITAADKI